MVRLAQDEGLAGIRTSFQFFINLCCQLDSPVIAVAAEVGDEEHQEGQPVHGDGLVRPPIPGGVVEHAPEVVLEPQLIERGPGFLLLIFATATSMLDEVRVEPLAIEETHVAFFGVKALTARWLVVPANPGAIKWIAILVDLADS